MGLVVDGGELLGQDGELERRQIAARGRLRPRDVHGKPPGEERPARRGAPQIGVVPVQQNALLPQRLKVRGDAARARAVAEALDVGADGGVREAQII